MLITKELLNLFAPDGKCCEDFLEKWEGKELTIASVAEAYCGTADEVNWLLEVKRKQYCVGTSVNERLHNDLHGIKDFLLQIQKSLNEKPKTFKLALNTDDHPSRHIHADHYLNAWQWLDFHGMQGVNRYVPLPMKEKLQAKIELEVNRKGSIPAKELAPILLEWLETGQTEVNRRDK